MIMIITTVYNVEAKSGEKKKRPSISGITNAAFFAKDIENTHLFYTSYLGFAGPVGTELSEAVIKLNERQSVEIFPEKYEGGNRLDYFSIETSDAAAMRVYLASKGVRVPARITEKRNGNLCFMITDFNGTVCEIIQHISKNISQQNLPETRIASRMSHVGFMVPDLDKAMAFYHDILGFQETWRGSKNGENINWVNLRVPEGVDYIELMLFDQQPSEADMGVLNHICLEVNDVTESSASLAKRELPTGCKIPTAMKTGINRKRQINCYDKDGTRVEIMEAKTVDGKPVPSSTAPPLKFLP
jgi:catechol 2,3-dioxygenase-like lactoylglutathione lyase family enzyme